MPPAPFAAAHNQRVPHGPARFRQRDVTAND